MNVLDFDTKMTSFHALKIILVNNRLWRNLAEL